MIDKYTGQDIKCNLCDSDVIINGANKEYYECINKKCRVLIDRISALEDRIDDLMKDSKS